MIGTAGRDRRWPPHWRIAAGLPARAEFDEKPARTIADVTEESASRQVFATIEGDVVGSHRSPFAPAPGFTLSDATGLALLVPDRMTGSWEANQDGWRLQFDIEASPEITVELLTRVEGERPRLVARTTAARIASQSRDPGSAPRVMAPRGTG